MALIVVVAKITMHQIGCFNIEKLIIISKRKVKNKLYKYNYKTKIKTCAVCIIDKITIFEQKFT